MFWIWLSINGSIPRRINPSTALHILYLTALQVLTSGSFFSFLSLVSIALGLGTKSLYTQGVTTYATELTSVAWVFMALDVSNRDYEVV